MVDTVSEVSGLFCCFPFYFSVSVIVYSRVTNNDGAKVEFNRGLIALVRRGRYI